MNISELIKQLQQFPPGTKVVIRGYEEGYNDILKLDSLKIKRKSKSKWYEGEYEKSTEVDAITAIDLLGENTNAQE